MKLHDIREAIRLLRGGELAVLRGSIFGLHVEVTLRPYDPAEPREEEAPASGQVQRDDVRCTSREAVRCPLHGNCCCTHKEGRRRAWSGCPLHADWSQHADPHGGGAA